MRKSLSQLENLQNENKQFKEKKTRISLLYAESISA